jgi:hypothetical protein
LAEHSYHLGPHHGGHHDIYDTSVQGHLTCVFSRHCATHASEFVDHSLEVPTGSVGERRTVHRRRFPHVTPVDGKGGTCSGIRYLNCVSLVLALGILRTISVVHRARADSSSYAVSITMMFTEIGGTKLA